MHTLQYLCLFFLIATYIKAQKHDLEDKNTDKVRACGVRLSQVLNVVCDGEFAFGTKRSDELSQYQHPIFSVMEPRPSDSNECRKLKVVEQFNNANKQDREVAMYPFKDRYNAQNFLYFTRHQRSAGIIQECCLKACTLKELKGYCSQDDTVPQQN